MQCWSPRSPERFTSPTGARLHLRDHAEASGCWVRGLRQGFGLLSGAEVAIEPIKLELLVGLPQLLTRLYLQRFLTRPSSELILARHANAVPGEMLKLVEELRAVVRLEPHQAPDREVLWSAVTAAANRDFR